MGDGNYNITGLVMAVKKFYRTVPGIGLATQWRKFLRNIPVFAAHNKRPKSQALTDRYR